MNIFDTNLYDLNKIKNDLILGIEKYCKTNNFKSIVIGISGGLDSAVTAALAIKAIKRQNVELLYMPSKFSKSSSFVDEFSNIFNIPYKIIYIQNIFELYLEQLNNFGEINIPEENLQARIRGNILMYHSNKNNSLLLATGNKSELLTGYFTLYGDSCGGLCVLGDLYKTVVFKLAKELGIPKSIINRAPSAELNQNQLDSDSLPEYEILDTILYYLIDLKMKENEISELTRIDIVTINNIKEKVNKTEFKRKQCPDIIKLF